MTWFGAGNWCGISVPWHGETQLCKDVQLPRLKVYAKLVIAYTLLVLTSLTGSNSWELPSPFVLAASLSSIGPFVGILHDDCFQWTTDLSLPRVHWTTGPSPPPCSTPRTGVPFDILNCFGFHCHVCVLFLMVRLGFIPLHLPAGSGVKQQLKSLGGK